MSKRKLKVVEVNPTGMPMVRFKVTRPITQLSHGQDVFRVVDGYVDLPAADWYEPLRQAGTLVKVEK